MECNDMSTKDYWESVYASKPDTALNLRRCAFSGTSGSGELATKGTATLASLTMILLATPLCNYGRGFCLIDIGTEGSRSRFSTACFGESC